VRTSDIDEVGDDSHLTLFEMLGNWSLGDYFATESLAGTLELLTGTFGLDQARLAVMVFQGDDTIPFDQVAYDRWRELGIPSERIFPYGRTHNWCCLYISPSKAEPGTTEVRSWVPARRAELDRVLSETVDSWLAGDWPFTEVRCRA
jgi:tRNA synthetases class II (A)